MSAVSKGFHLAVAALAAAALVEAAPQSGLSRAAARERAEALSRLGAALFDDVSLSASGRIACATCHDRTHAFASPTAAPVASGGADGRRPGHRAVPSLKYLQAVPPFTAHFFDDEADGSVDNGPTGGLTWDGRVDHQRDQAAIPLLSPFEMANSADALRARLAAGPHAADLGRLFGASALTDAAASIDAVGTALDAFQHSPTVFYPYTSKYDAYLRGQVELAPDERRGLEAFEAKDRGNCARCHISRPDPKGQPPQFTDYGLIALGLPRNPAIPDNADASHFDLGLCGPDRTDLSGRTEYCGRFRTPTLRNVATRRVFFHNGAATTLARAVAFYVERDTQPDRWYPARASGAIAKFDDLPRPYWPNVDAEPPFGGRPGDARRLSDRDIENVVAFLRTLTDGFVAPPPRLVRPPQRLPTRSAAW